MSFTNAAETLVLNWLLTSGAATRPTAWYIALFTVAPGEAGGGTEVSGGGYARQAATFTVSGNTASNSANVEWPAATGAWGTVVAAAIMDAASGGNMLTYANLTASKTVASGDTFRFLAGDFDVTLD